MSPQRLLLLLCSVPTVASSVCEKIDGDCPSCPLLSFLSPVAEVALSGEPRLVAAATRVDAILRNVSGDADIQRFDAPKTGLHTSLFYFCCHSPGDLATMHRAFAAWNWTSVNTNYSDFGCNLDHDNKTVYLHALPTNESQAALFAWARAVEDQISAFGVTINHPRKSKFHMTLARVSPQYPIDKAVAMLRGTNFGMHRLCSFTFSGKTYTANDCAPSSSSSSSATPSSSSPPSPLVRMETRRRGATTSSTVNFSDDETKNSAVLLAPNAPVRLIVALRHQNVELLEKTFWDVSNPASSRYGQHLSRKEVADMVAPPAAALDALSRWVEAASYGAAGMMSVHPLTPGGEWMEVVGATAQSAGALLHCTIVAEPPRCASGEYYLPADLARHVDYVSGMGRRRQIRSRDDHSSSASELESRISASNHHHGSGNGNKMTPAILRGLYGVPANVVASADATQATAQFNVRRSNNYSPNDLTQFHEKYAVGNPSDPPTIVVVGGNDAAHPGIEGTLDVQYLSGVAGGKVTTTWWNTNATCTFAQWAIEVLGSENPPLVHSVSYDDFEEQDSDEFMRRGDEEFLKVRTRTILFVSSYLASFSFLTTRTCTYLRDVLLLITYVITF